jgi:hypothetical protein
MPQKSLNSLFPFFTDHTLSNTKEKKQKETLSFSDFAVSEEHNVNDYYGC